MRGLIFLTTSLCRSEPMPQHPSAKYCRYLVWIEKIHFKFRIRFESNYLHLFLRHAIVSTCKAPNQYKPRFEAYISGVYNCSQCFQCAIFGLYTTA